MIPGVQIPVALDRLVDFPGLEDGFTIPGRVSQSLITGWSLPALSLPGHPHFPTFEETVDSGPGNLAPPPSGFPDWDPSTHAAYTDSSCPYSAAEGFLTPDFYPPSDPGRSGPFPLGMEVNFRGDRHLRSPLCQA